MLNVIDDTDSDCMGASPELTSADAFGGRAPTPYGRHDRYWIPLECPQAARFYFNHLFVAHSRSELFFGAVARRTPWLDSSLIVPAKTTPDNIINFGSEPDLPTAGKPTLGSLAEVLQENLRPRGMTGPLTLMALENYQQTNRHQVVFFIFDPSSPLPCALAKVTSQEFQRILEHEFHALVELQQLLPVDLRRTIPEPFALLEHRGLSVLIETLVHGSSIYYQMRNSVRPAKGVVGHFRLAREWLVRFQKATRCGGDIFTQAILDDYVARPLEKYRAACRASHDENRMIDEAISAGRKLVGQHFALAAHQGDFWARNIITQDDSIGVVDWERFEKINQTFSDLFMFAVSYGLSYPWKLAHWSNPVAAFRGMCIEKSWLGDIVRNYLVAYCNEMKLAPEMIEVFFPVFLAERAVEEFEQSQKSPALNGQGATTTLWQDLFRESAHHGGSVCFG